jgi:hypothetical protein
VYVAGFLGTSGTGVYDTPHGNSTAVVWKNGVAQTLTVGERAKSNSIYVSGNDVYVVVHDGDKSKIWKNGKEMLTSSLLFVQGSDVYALVGRDEKGYLWKNGVMTELASITNMPNYGICAFCVSGNDVYVAGTHHYPETVFSSPMVWKNGETTILSGDRLGQSYAYSMFVVD